MSPPNQPDSIRLEKFPSDILLHISNFFMATPGLYASTKAEANRRSENAKRKNTLHSLTLTCRRFYSLFQSMLYQSFIQTPEDTTSARLLLRTLVDQPGLSKHIQYVETTYIRIDVQPKPRQFTSPYSINALPFDQAVHDQWQEFERHFSMIQWQPNLQHAKPFEWFHYEHIFGRAWVEQEPEAYIAWIMATTPNLKMVAIFNQHVLYTATIASRAYQNTHGLRRLWLGQRAPARDRESGRPLKVTSVLSEAIIVTYPVSEKLTLVNAYSYLIPAMYHRIPNAWFWGPDTHGLVDLTLEACEISSDHLHKMLSKHTSLKYFTCRWGACLEEVDNLFPQAIDLVGLKSVLSASKCTLEYLVLDTRNAGQKTVSSQIVPAIGSLRCFSMLKYLEVCDIVFWGYNQGEGIILPSPEHLPESLEVLIIRSKWNAEVEHFLLAISKQDGGLLPKLRLVDCSYDLGSQTKSTEIVARQFKEASIELRL